MRYQVSGIRYRVSGIGYLVPGMGYQVSGAWYRGGWLQQAGDFGFDVFDGGLGWFFIEFHNLFE